MDKATLFLCSCLGAHLQYLFCAWKTPLNIFKLHSWQKLMIETIGAKSRELIPKPRRISVISTAVTWNRLYNWVFVKEHAQTTSCWAIFGLTWYILWRENVRDSESKRFTQRQAEKDSENKVTVKAKSWHGELSVVRTTEDEQYPVDCKHKMAKFSWYEILKTFNCW